MMSDEVCVESVKTFSTFRMCRNHRVKARFKDTGTLGIPTVTNTSMSHDNSETVKKECLR